MKWITMLVLAILEVLLEARAQKFQKHQNGVGCYKCYSFNGSDAHCGDPFHPAFNMQRFYSRCEQGMDNRVGTFPARYCTKIKGTNLETNEELIVRSCSMSAFDNTCGLFEFENVRYSGCLMSCTRTACNSGHALHRSSSRTFAAVCAGLLCCVFASMTSTMPTLFARIFVIITN